MRRKTLVGRKTSEVRRWADWYRQQRGLTWLSVDELIDAALREQGTRKGVTKTKLRKAATRFLAHHQAANRTDRVA